MTFVQTIYLLTLVVVLFLFFSVAEVFAHSLDRPHRSVGAAQPGGDTRLRERVADARREERAHRYHRDAEKHRFAVRNPSSLPELLDEARRRHIAHVPRPDKRLITHLTIYS